LRTFTLPAANGDAVWIEDGDPNNQSVTAVAIGVFKYSSR
jgi:hypothetical protein